MAIKLETSAREEGTYVITCSFTDEEGQDVVPNNNLVWTLKNRAGEVINERENISISPATSITVVLYGNDLLLPDEKDFFRIFLIEGTYNSSLGNDLPIREAAEFPISNI